jgi:hypothetical protein
LPDQNVEVAGLDDASLFQSTFENNAPAGDTGSEVDSQQDGEQSQPRDERGRFASKETQQDPPQSATESVPSAQPTTDGQSPPSTEAEVHVPSWRLREEREAREAAARRAEQAERFASEHQRQLAELQRQLAELRQPKQEPIDPLVDPDGYHKRITEEFRAELQRIRLDNNLELARVRHGDTFDKAFEAFKEAIPSNPGWFVSVINGPNPGEAIVNWHKREAVLTQVGADPNVWLEKQIEERMKDPAFLAKAIEAAKAQANNQANGSGNASGARPNNITQLPPSLSRVAGSGRDPRADDDDSDGAIFRHALARG